MFRRILVANRGEIALRVMRACREMDIQTVAIYSEVDRVAAHVRFADYAVSVGAGPAAESYLNIERVIDAARRSGADALHPGYGFLSENAEFAQACQDAGLTFIGPSPEAIRVMGDKIVARKHMIEAGVPVVPGAEGAACASAETALVAAREIGFPVMVKATAGGGGKGMRLVESEADFSSAFAAARREAAAAFGNGTVYLEKFVVKPRHVEVQLVADSAANVLHLYERDCSIQRRHQKLVEETPCPVLDAATREQMGQVAVRAAKSVGYVSAGTVEFLYSQGSFYFLEMNTRLQVEHPITELCTGVDLVHWQIQIANGRQLPLRQAQIQPRGAAIECRICAEDPVRFLPSPGQIGFLREPAGPGIRVDSGVVAGSEISSLYDPMIAKLCTWASDRPAAIARMRRALSEYRIAGVQSNLRFHRRVMRDPVFASGEYDTGFIVDHPQLLAAEAEPVDREVLAVAAAEAARTAQAASSVEVSIGPSAWRRAAGWRG